MICYSLFILLVVVTSDVLGVQTCNKKIKNCEGESCFKSIACYHGDCSDSGVCECDLCWQGDECSEYVDRFLPLFPKLEEIAVVSDPWNPDSVYTAIALDGDQETTCPLEAMICDCAEIVYSIDSGNDEGLFHMNNLTGDIFIREAARAKSGNTYTLIISAKSATGQKHTSPYSSMQLKIIIDDLHHHLQNVLQQNVLSWIGDDEQHIREKRSAEVGNYLTEFNFTLLSGELETMECGRRLDYRLEIAVPKTDNMDLTVEIFTKEIGNGNYTPSLALFNVDIEEKPKGLTFSKGVPHTEMLLSDEIMTAYDRAIITFGDVKNTALEPLPIVITFSVTQLRNVLTAFDTKFLVTVGAEYDKETYIWVGQSEVTVHNSTDEKTLEVDILGPKEIPLDSAGVYVIKAYCAVRSENFTFDVTGPEQTDVVTVGNLGVKDFDTNYDPVPQSIYFYNTTKEGSDDDVIYTSASLNLGIMTNVGNYKEAREEGNVINVTFAIYALNNETNLNKEVDFVVSITVGREVLYKKPFTVKLVPRVDAKEMVTARVTKGDLTSTAVAVGDMAVYTLWSNLTNNGYADYILQVGVPRDNKGLPRLESCSARLWNYKGSFDVPYINTTFIDPEIKDGKFIFRFNRIHVTGQRTPSIYNDSMIFVHLVVKISAMAVNKPESRLTPIISIGTNGKAETEVKVPAIVVAASSEYQIPVMEVENGVQWPYLYGGGAIVLNITMLVPRGQGYAQVQFEASGENNPPLPAVHICRAELSDVGRNVPCLRMHQTEVNQNFTSYAKTDAKVRTRPDMTSVMLGDVGALPVEGKNRATVSVVVELPEGENFKDNDQYPISSGLLISSKSIWSSMANYTMKKSAPPDLIQDQMPEASAYHDTEELVVPGHLAQVEIWVDTKIQTISAFIIEVEGVTKDISLCGLKVKSFGRNLPCVNMNTEPFYHPHANPLDGNKIAGIKFSALSNVGFRSDVEHDRLKVIALVRIGPSCRQPQTELKWRVIFGGGRREGAATIKVDLNADTSDMSVSAKEPKALAFKPAYPNKAISMGTPVVVDLEVSLEPGSLAPVIVSMKNADANKKRFPYDMCLGGIWFRGRNYPCFSPVQVESNFSSSDSEGKNDSAVYNLGLVCNTFVDNREEENKVTVRLAMRPVDDGSLKIRDHFSVEGFATVGTHSKKIDTVKFSIAREPDQIETGVNATVKLVNPDPIPIRIHQRLWIPFNISIPIDAVVKVEAEARSPVKDDRAILTVHGMRLVSGGVNIPCPMLYPQPKLVFKPTVTTTQKDVVRGSIGYFTNLGLTHKMNMAEEGDDDLTVEVEVEMTDHPLTDHEKIFQLKFVAEVGRSIIDIDQPMQVWRDGVERADLDVKIKVDNSKTYQSGDRINVTVSIVHTQASTAEPINATIRLYLPPYIAFENKIFENSTAKSLQFVTEFGGLDIILSQFLFSDSATIIISLLADPNNERGFGRGEANATTPYRVLCMQNFREEPSANPLTPEQIVNCGPVDYIMYLVNSQECFKPLGLNSPKKIYKCQISASSAAKKDTGPFNIRFGGKKGWSPALRLGTYKPHLDVDMLRPTRVSKIEMMKIDDTRCVTKYRLQYSNTGSDWLYANEVTELVYKKGGIAVDILDKPIQTRFVRVIIEEAEKGDEDSKYIGLKMEMYGCYIGEKSPSVSCAKNDPTWYSDDKNKYGRHFSVDTGRDIVYFCDLEYDMKNLLCFSSTDTGNSWRILPRSIGGILGYEKKSGRTYAIDKRKRAYVASDDGISWVAVDELEVNTTYVKKSYYKSQPVPAFTSEDIEMLETKTGRWEASFDGLMYENKPDPRAKWSRCCKLK